MWLQRTNWRASDAHLLLLTKYCDGNSPDTYMGSEDWESVLGEKPREAIGRFLDESMLQPAELPRILDYNFTASELKSMLRQKAIKVSGRKAEIILRLIENDAAGMRAITKTATIYECTVQGAQLAHIYLKEHRERKLITEQESMAMLVKQDFVEAVRLMSQYEAEQVFPRGIGIDWSSFDYEPLVETLRVIFGRPPGILKGLNRNRLGEVRVAAGMVQLWGVGDAKRWLSGDLEIGTSFDADVAARMLCFYSKHVKQMEEYRDSDLEGFVTGVEISAIDDGRHCAECSQISGKKFELGQVPELPFAKCTSEIGCRCMAIPITVIDEL